MTAASSHYSGSQKRGSRDSLDHALRGCVEEALRVLATVAAEDADFAKSQNGRGFSRSDQEGHALSRCKVEQVLHNETLRMKVLAMGKRYCRQAATINQLSLF